MVKWIFILFTVLCSGPNQGRTQLLQASFPSTCTGISGWGSEQAGAFSWVRNPALLTELKGLATGFYGDRKFFSSDLGSYLLAASFPLQTLGFGIRAGTAGSVGYKELLAGIAIARNLGNSLAIGIGVNYVNRAIPLYGSIGQIAAEAGVIFRLSEKLTSAFHAYHHTGGLKEEALPAVYTLGFTMQTSRQFALIADISKHQDQAVTVNAAAGYSPVDNINIRLGIASATTTIVFSIGYRVKKLRLDILTTHHPHLGISPGMMLQFGSQKKPVE